MKPALLLIDLQNDFLRSTSLEPPAGDVVASVAALLKGCRRLSIPVIHVWTTVGPGGDRRMPHWRRTGKWACVEGTEGHAAPGTLRPLESEKIVHKTFFSAFADGRLDAVLSSLGSDTIFLGGLHLHGCVRATVLDAYQRGYRIWVAEDAVASDDPVHAAITRRYLERRAARFAPTDSLLSLTSEESQVTVIDSPPVLPAMVVADTVVDDAPVFLTHRSPGQSNHSLWRVRSCGEGQVSRATLAARHAWSHWKDSPITRRVEILERLAGLLVAESRALAEQMAIEIGKPVFYGEAEISRCISLIEAVNRHAGHMSQGGGDVNSFFRYRPLGVVAVVTPWNNPLAIPVGKIAPALFYGNTVVWKPSPYGSSVALRLMDLLRSAGCPPGVVNLVFGDRATAEVLMEDERVDAVTLTGSSAAGYLAQEICARRRIPLQAELGGNNASIVWPDCDLERAAFTVAEAAFGFAGQRCTANRRAIVESRCYDAFLRYLEKAVASLNWGDPIGAGIRVGPLISDNRRSGVAAVVERAKAVADVFAPHEKDSLYAELTGAGAFYPPTVICCDDLEHEVVQEETFGPVMVVQRAYDWDHAMRLCNGVRQGLVAALFSNSKEVEARFLEDAQAGVLKVNIATADVGVEAPFGGWKASGVGPPEHGTGNREFYTRIQSIYKQTI